MKPPKKIAEQLQDNEIVVIKKLKELNKADVSKLASLTRLPEVSVGRAGLWLQNKELIKISKQKSKYVVLDTLGKKYASSTLPEFRLLKLLIRPMTLSQLSKFLTQDELKFSIGYLKKKGLINFFVGKAEITERGKRLERSLESDLLNKLNKKEIELDSLEPEEKHAYLELSKRKQMIKTIEKTITVFDITDLGKKVVGVISTVPTTRIGQLTPKMLETGNWKDRTFRRYDVEAAVPRLFAGKKQPYLAFLDEVKQELISMGFEEMSGPLVETSLFNCDALYMPQDHPARGIHDNYFVKGKANVNKYSEELSNIKETHENGGESGSIGWKAPFSREVAAQLLLRSQGTALSARTLASKPKIPGKYFAITRCFRPDVVDATHLTEFNQLEGIVIGEEVNFRQLLGLLKDFAVRIGKAKKIKFSPVAYFPFTEASVTGYIWHEGLNKWIEVMPAGIFRPELCKPLGIDVPVLAWGIGIDRLFMIRKGIKDIRYLFSQDLKWLRETSV